MQPGTLSDTLNRLAAAIESGQSLQDIPQMGALSAALANVAQALTTAIQNAPAGTGGGTAATPNITATASVDDSGGTPAVTVTKTGTQAAPVLSFAFSGLRGADGAPGKDGVDGAPGRDGRDGADGQPGAPGRDGVDGKDGAPGRDGVDGKDGRDGVDGKDGDPADTSNIAAGLAALQNRLANMPWTVTIDNEYGNLYWRITNGILFLVSGSVIKEIPAKQNVFLCTLPDTARGTGIIYAPVFAANGVTGGAVFDAQKGTVGVWMNTAVSAGSRIFVNIACPAS